MKIEIQGKEFELRTTLGTVKLIEREFNRESIIKIIERAENMSAEDLIKLIKPAVKKEEQQEFVSLLEENYGIGEAYELIGEYVEQLMYPGKTKEEIKEIQEINLKKQKSLNKVG